MKKSKLKKIIREGIISRLQEGFKWPQKFTLTKGVRVNDKQYIPGEYLFKKEGIFGGMYQQGYNSMNAFRQAQIEKWVEDGTITI